ncbi:nuclear transport factor 2 family protein [Actinoplanes sp. NPDC048791]|uniref:nuclear transport factor 2 family protein n=1 Tax=Actinoplanes sp. NPDC048791 TaxID=3154623 RepID=UPI0033E695F0
MNITALDHMQIAGVVAALAHAQDDKDWERFRQLFADRVTLDQSGQSGAPAEELTADELTTKARTVLEGFAATHHASSDLLVDATGAGVTGRAHMVAYHHLPTTGVDFCVMRGYWRLELIRARERWLIRRWAIVRTAPWEGNPDLYRIASKGKHRVVAENEKGSTTCGQ